MTIDELKAQWEIDCVIEDDLGEAARRSPKLHSKYIDETISSKLKLTKIQHEIAELRAAKARYFRGEMTQDELIERNWKQWQYKTLRADIDGMIDAEPDYQKLVARESYMKAMLYFLESVMGEIKNRNWNVRAIIDWTRFRAGS